MGTAAKKKRPMRSRRSGVKKFKQYMSNWEVLKKLGAFVLILFIASCTPVQYVYVNPQDSTVHKQRIIYSNIYLHTPFYFNQYSPYYYSPRIIVPVNPSIHYKQAPHYIPRGGRR